MALEIGDEGLSLLGQLELGGHVRKETFPLHETQTPETARMPPAEAVVYSLTDAGRNAIAK